MFPLWVDFIFELNLSRRNNKMAVPKRKTSRMQRRQRKAANRYEGVQATYCKDCGAPCEPHRVCPACGKYEGKQILTVK
jgi:large subunit ribosomal protein L32